MRPRRRPRPLEPASNYAPHAFRPARWRVRSCQPAPEPDHPEWSREHLQCAALDRTAALEQLGKVDTDGIEAGMPQLCRETRCSGGKNDVQAVGDDVQPERVGV